MSTTPSLLIPLIGQSQNNKELTANSAFDQLDTAVNSKIQETLSGAEFDLPIADFINNGAFEFIGVIPPTFDIVLLPSLARVFIARNDTTPSGSGMHEVVLSVGTGAQNATLADNNWHLILSDGVSRVYLVS